MLVDFVLILSVFTLPWWAGALVGALGVVVFPWFVEIFFASVVLQLFYGGSDSFTWTNAILICSLFLVIFEIIGKPNLRIYGK